MFVQGNIKNSTKKTQNNFLDLTDSNGGKITIKKYDNLILKEFLSSKFFTGQLVYVSDSDKENPVLTLKSCGTILLDQLDFVGKYDIY